MGEETQRGIFLLHIMQYLFWKLSTQNFPSAGKTGYLPATVVPQVIVGVLILTNFVPAQQYDLETSECSFSLQKKTPPPLRSTAWTAEGLAEGSTPSFSVPFIHCHNSSVGTSQGVL